MTAGFDRATNGLATYIRTVTSPPPMARSDSASKIESASPGSSRIGRHSGPGRC
jgi:hypothetical protein